MVDACGCTLVGNHFSSCHSTCLPLFVLTTPFGHIHRVYIIPFLPNSSIQILVMRSFTRWNPHGARDVIMQQPAHSPHKPPRPRSSLRCASAPGLSPLFCSFLASSPLRTSYTFVASAIYPSYLNCLATKRPQQLYLCQQTARSYTESFPPLYSSSHLQLHPATTRLSFNLHITPRHHIP